MKGQGRGATVRHSLSLFTQSTGAKAKKPRQAKRSDERVIFSLRINPEKTEDAALREIILQYEREDFDFKQLVQAALFAAEGVQLPKVGGDPFEEILDALRGLSAAPVDLETTIETAIDAAIRKYGVSVAGNGALNSPEPQASTPDGLDAFAMRFRDSLKKRGGIRHNE